jgi:hypothetical protein
VLKIDGTAVTGNAISISDLNQTLEIGAAGYLTINATESITSGTIRIDGGTLTDSADITIGSGATLIGFGLIAAGGDIGGTGTITASGGILEFQTEIDGVAASSLHIDGGATLKFDAAVGTTSVHPTVFFDGATGFLDLRNISLASFHGVIADYGHGDGMYVTGADHTSLDEAGTLLTVFNSANQAIGTISFGTSQTGKYFHVINGNEIVTCFMPGTLVRTPGGDVAVETLQPGDLVITTEGRAEPIRWLGRQTVSRVFADPLRVLPIRIMTGALGENVPARDLLISPDHAVLIDGVLVQAGALVNGTSIVRETKVPMTYTYYHVELDDHSLILAENLAAETFVDNVDRLAFDNWDEHEALYPDGKPIVEMPYPRAKAHRQVPRTVRAKLATRATMLSRPIAEAA